MKQVRFFLLIFLIGFFLLFNSCLDTRKEYLEGNTAIEKQEKDTTVINNAANLSQFIHFQRKKTSSSYRLKGKVVSIVQTNFWHKKEGENLVRVSKKLKTDSIEFNASGQLVRHNTYADDGELFFINTYMYDDNDFLVNYHESNDVRFVVGSTPIYSKDGLIIKETHFNKEDIAIGESVIDFKEEDRTIIKTTVWSGGETKNKMISKVDAKGNILSQTFYESILSEGFGLSAESVNEYSYQENNIMDEKQYNPWGIFENYKERLYVTINNSYDLNNLLKESTYIKKDGTVDYVLTYTYQLDKQNNWIEKTITKNGVKESSFQREITYLQ